MAQVYLEGTYSEIYPDVTRDVAGLRKLFRQFSTPGGIPSHVSAPTPGSIHEGGELGYVLTHAFGAVFDDPSLLAVAVVGDGEAETGPLGRAGRESASSTGPRRRGAAHPSTSGYRSPAPPCAWVAPPAPVRSLLGGAATGDAVVEGDVPPRSTGPSPRRSGSVQRIGAIQAARGGQARAVPLAGAGPAHTQGMDRAEGGRRRAGGGTFAPRVPWPASANRSTSGCWRRG